jgi:hypothetical protein
MPKHPPWKSLTTVGAITVVAVVAMLSGQETLAAAAVGALVGYLGKLNGSR